MKLWALHFKKTGVIFIEEVVVLEWFVHYRIYFSLKSDPYALTAECFNEWIVAGREQQMRHEMDSDSWLWRCQLIPPLVSLLGFRWLPPGFPGKKNQHFGCQVLLKRSGTESIENCWRLEVAVVPEQLETFPCIHPSVQNDVLEWDNSHHIPKKMGLMARSPSLCFSPLLRCAASDLSLSHFSPYKPGLLWLKV